MKQCPQCKAKTVDDEALYCTECGAALDGKPSASPPVKAAVKPPPSKSPALSVSRGHKVDLTKAHPNLERIRLDLGWRSAADFDIDAAAFLLGANGKVMSDADFVFYNNPKHVSSSVEHVRRQAGDERISIDLKRVPDNVKKIAVSLTINEAEQRKQTFEKVHDMVLSVVDDASGNELVRYALEDSFTVETAIVVGEVYQHKGQWKFHAIGAGFKGGLAALCNNFGIAVD